MDIWGPANQAEETVGAKVGMCQVLYFQVRIQEQHLSWPSAWSLCQTPLWTVAWSSVNIIRSCYKSNGFRVGPLTSPQLSAHSRGPPAGDCESYTELLKAHVASRYGFLKQPNYLLYFVIFLFFLTGQNDWEIYFVPLEGKPLSYWLQNRLQD